MATALAGLREKSRRLRAEVDALDRAVADAVLRTPTPTLDPIIRRLSRASDYKGLWLTTSTVVAVVDGQRGRRAAVRCLATVGVASVVADVVAKRAVRRQRPEDASVPQDRVARRPTSSSFPSSHTASAVAFAAAFAREYPIFGMPINALAAAVGYSRVHTGVHYASDVMAGAVLGSSTASLTNALFDRVDRWRQRT